jgi:catechol 2,3-dioxygenase-like lactoylglutathione lyase family enzyme
LAFADLNRDGLLDIVRATKTGITVLLNSGGFRFERQPIKVRNQNGSEGRVTPGAEIPNLVDFNKDGYLDIFITTSGGRGQYAKRIGNKGNQLLVSDGSPFSFVDVSDQMHIRNADGWNRQSSITDVNRDGWLDIAIGSDNISDGRAGLPHSRLYVFKPKGMTFEDGTFEDIGGTDLVPDFGGFYGNPDKDRAGPGIVLRDLDNDGDFDLVQGYHMDTHGRIDGEYPVALYDYGVFCWKNLFAETGRFRFERIKDNGLAQRGKLKFRAPFDYDVVERAVALPFISTGDVDNDGLLDVIAIGSCQPTFFAGWASGKSGQFWRNLGGFRFQEATDKSGLASLNWDNRQWLEFFGIPITPAMRESSDSRYPSKDWLTFKIYGGSAVFADFNNDGWLDLLVANRKWSFPQNIFRNALYLNNGDGTFHLLKSEESGIFDNGLFAEAVDLDNDGLLDLVFARDPENNSPIVIDSAAGAEASRRFTRGGSREYPEEVYHSLILRNKGQFGGRTNHWLRLRFAGVTDAELAGAKVWVYEPGGTERTGSKPIGTRVVFSSQHHKSGTPMEVHFGLGTHQSVDVAVTLGNGRRVVFTGLKANQFAELDLQKHQSRPVVIAASTATFSKPTTVETKSHAAKLDLPSLMAEEALHTSVVVSDLAKARQFYGEALGLRPVGEPRRMPDSSMMHIFRAGASMIKVRVYDTPPPNRGGEIAAVNGIRFIGVPVPALQPVLDRLKQKGFPIERTGERDGAHIALVADSEGNRVELIEAGEQAATRGIELGIVVGDLTAAKSFADGLLGLKPLPEIDSLAIPGLKEHRYANGQSVLRFLAPPGERPSFEGRPSDAIGFRYITHQVRNVTAVFEAMQANAVKPAPPGRPVTYQQNSVMMAYGPGGALFEFVGPEVPNNTGSGNPAQPASGIEERLKQYDKNHDGKLDATEAGDRPFFTPADANHDGVLTLDEVKTYFSGARRRTTNPEKP